jgi:hypothetical protein
MKLERGTPLGVCCYYQVGATAGPLQCKVELLSLKAAAVKKAAIELEGMSRRQIARRARKMLSSRSVVSLWHACSPGNSTVENLAGAKRIVDASQRLAETSQDLAGSSTPQNIPSTIWCDLSRRARY